MSYAIRISKTTCLNINYIIHTCQLSTNMYIKHVKYLSMSFLYLIEWLTSIINRYLHHIQHDITKTYYNGEHINKYIYIYIYIYHMYISYMISIVISIVISVVISIVNCADMTWQVWAGQSSGVSKGLAPELDGWISVLTLWLWHIVINSDL